MKVIGICGSPRKGSNSEVLLDAALEACAGEGAQTEKILLSEMEIENCQGCISCPDECVTGDNAWDTIDHLKDADGIIVASPTYSGTPSGLLTSFQDRAVYLGRSGGLLANKVGGSIAVAASEHGGQEFVNLHNIIWFLKAKMIVATEARGMFMGVAARARTEGEVRENERAMEEAGILGRRVVELIKLTGKG
jgi:multimeric flavodoxin WrbA